jgi:hypothetical protein
MALGPNYLSEESLRRLQRLLRAFEGGALERLLEGLSLVRGEQFLVGKAEADVEVGTTGTFKLFRGHDGKGLEVHTEGDTIDAYLRMGPRILADEWALLVHRAAGYEAISTSGLGRDRFVSGAPCSPFSCIHPGQTLDGCDHCPCGPIVWTFVLSFEDDPECDTFANQQVLTFQADAAVANTCVWRTEPETCGAEEYRWSLYLTAGGDARLVLETYDAVAEEWVGLQTYSTDDFCCLCDNELHGECPPYLPVLLNNAPGKVCLVPWSIVPLPDWWVSLCEGPECDGLPISFRVTVGAGPTGTACGFGIDCGDLVGEHVFTLSRITDSLVEYKGPRVCDLSGGGQPERDPQCRPTLQFTQCGIVVQWNDPTCTDVEVMALYQGSTEDYVCDGPTTLDKQSGGCGGLPLTITIEPIEPTLPVDPDDPNFGELGFPCEGEGAGGSDCVECLYRSFPVGGGGDYQWIRIGGECGPTCTCDEQQFPGAPEDFPNAVVSIPCNELV